MFADTHKTLYRFSFVSIALSCSANTQYAFGQRIKIIERNIFWVNWFVSRQGTIDEMMHGLSAGVFMYTALYMKLTPKRHRTCCRECSVYHIHQHRHQFLWSLRTVVTEEKTYIRKYSACVRRRCYVGNVTSIFRLSFTLFLILVRIHAYFCHCYNLISRQS